MNNTPSNGYNPVTNYMDQYGNSVRFDPETNQYVAVPQSSVQPVQTAYTQTAAPGFVAPPSSISPSRQDPLDNTLKTDKARKPFRRLAGQVGFSMILYLIFDVIFGYIIIYIPYLLNLKNAVAGTDAAELFFRGEYLEAYRTVIDYVQSVIPESAFTTWHLVAVIVGAIFATFLPMFILARQNGFKPFSVFRKGTKYGRGLTIKAICAAFAVTIVWSLIYQLLSYLIPAVGNSDMGMDLPETIPAMILYVAYVVIGAPIFEEFIFRGVMLKALTPYGTLFAAMVTSILFGLLHGNLQQTPFAFGVGLILAYVAIKTGSIRTGIFIHFLVNFFSTLMQILTTYCSTAVITAAGIFDLLLYGAAVLTTLVVLIADRSNISFVQQPWDGNNIVLPVKEEQPAKKWLHAFTALGMLLFLIVIVFSIISSTGVFSPVE